MVSKSYFVMVFAIEQYCVAIRCKIFAMKCINTPQCLLVKYLHTLSHKDHFLLLFLPIVKGARPFHGCLCAFKDTLL